MLRASVVLSWLALSLMGAQSSTPSFEVASVKRAADPPHGSNGHGATGFSVSSDAAFVRYSGVSLQWLIMKAFETNEFAITGPAWIATERYDVVAKLREGANKSEIPAMLQQLLVERFHLVVRQEEKAQKDYAMVVEKSGLRLKPASGTDGPSAEGIDMRPSGMTITSMPLGRLAEIIGRLLRLPVVDSTGIDGRFDGILPLSSSDIAALFSPGSDLAQSDSDGNPSGRLFGALREIGLNLVAHVSSVRVVAVVSADKAPTSN
jgi:uncharacterized protein (TIGR03435 family)